MNELKIFDETKVTFDVLDGEETAWYDITDIVNELFAGKSSVMEYAEKVEMELYNFYPSLDKGEDKMKVIQKSFKSRVAENEYNRFMCEEERSGEVAVYNDAGHVRVTFKNGSKLTAINSEWGGVIFHV
ncbi:MAG: hypothetical protein IKN24_03415 [Lachnospiraceae bacterium]|nr:hypothetical protein [Lachnospiraceae bacterium]